MKKNSTLLTVSLLGVVALLTGCHASGDGGFGASSTFNGETKYITIDGGGDIANFNTTASMDKNEANPYPYNTLETLCKEWENNHPGYKVKINKTSAEGDSSVLIPQLMTKTACDIIYQNGTMVNSTLNQGYYADLTEYLNKQNPYDNNRAWKELYNQAELATTQASDGHYYYVNLEKNPVCFMYNKTLLNKAGVSNPESISTFAQLLVAMEKVKTYTLTQSDAANYATYSGPYTWYQIAMETNLFSDLVPLGDTIRENKMIDMEEMCRLYTKKLYDPSNGLTTLDKDKADQNDYSQNRLYSYINLIAQLDAYKAPASYYAAQGWATGKLGFYEATGRQLRNYAEEELGFEWGTLTFPDITTESCSTAGKGVVRGMAGLATSWWVSNSAIEGDKVDACVDLLMYLTSPKQNNKLIGDLQAGIPLNPTTDYQVQDYLKPLLAQYNSDVVDVNRAQWGSFNTWGVLGNNFQNLFIRTMQDLDAGINTPEQATCIIAKSLKQTITATIVENDYDTSNW